MLVNSNTILMDKPTATSVEMEGIQLQAMPLVSRWCSQQASGSTITTLPIIEPIICYVTAPRLDSTWFIDIGLTIPRMEVIYVNQLDVEKLLGDKGKCVLDKVTFLLKKVSWEQNWPIIRIEISFVKDEEVKDWQYILLRFIFHSTFETADNYLHDFYQKLDTFADTLSEEDEDILRRMFFFDVGTTI